MQKKLLGNIKVLLITFMLMLIMAFIYALIMQNQEESNYRFICLIIGGITFFFLGFLMSNHYQSKGFLVAFLSAFLILGIITIALIIADIGQESKYYVKCGIYLICAIAGGIIGVNIKKLI